MDVRGLRQQLQRWEGALPAETASSDSYDFAALGYGTPNWTVSGNVDFTMGNNAMLSARAGYFFIGVSNKLDPQEENTHLEPMYVMILGNQSITDVPATYRRPTGWQSRSTQSMIYPYEVDEESNLSAGLDFTYFLNLAGEHAWKAGVAFMKAEVNKDNMWNGPRSDSPAGAPLPPPATACPSKSAAVHLPRQPALPRHRPVRRIQQGRFQPPGHLPAGQLDHRQQAHPELRRAHGAGERAQLQR
jgi:hypothetical protein